MAQLPRIALEMDGLEELKDLLSTADQQLTALTKTVNDISIAQVKIQVKINQPSAATDD